LLTGFSIVLFGIGIANVLLAIFTLFRHKTSILNIFSLVCLGIAIYVIGYGFELRSETIEEIKFFLKTEYFGLFLMFPLWLLFIYEFYFNQAPSIKINIIVFIIPLLTLFFNVTNDFHHLFYTDIKAVQYEGFITAHLIKGPWYYVHIIYSYATLLIGVIFFLKAWYNSFNIRRIQSMLIIWGSIIPGIIEIFYLIGLSPYGLDLLPFSISIMAICYYIALFRYDFLELHEMIQDVIFNEPSEGIIVLDRQNRLIRFNKAAQKVYDFLNFKIVGKDLIKFTQGKELIDHKENIFEIAVGEDVPRYYEIRFTEMKSKNSILGSAYLMKEITQQKEMIQQLGNLANYDSLTPIYNRRRLVEEAEKEILRLKRYSGCFSILMIDIDNFKEINDEYGHLVGDEIIKSVVRGCQERIRRTDIIGRYGGDEFSILLPNTDNENAQIIAEEICRHIDDMEVIHLNQTIKATVSIGVATAAINSDKEIDLTELLKQADQALYKAKNNGRNRIST